MNIANSTARSNILKKLRVSQASSDATPAGFSPVPVQQRDHDARIARFCQMMEAVHTEIHHTTEDQWLPLLSELLAKKSVKTLLTAPATNIGKALLARPPAGTELVMADRPIEECKDQLFNSVDAAITGSHSGIAETGTIVLWPSIEEPRAMSLVPPIHFVLVRVDSIRNTFAETMAEEQWQDKMPTNALLISGPSKTADIQQTLAYGAHGPKELVVLLVGIKSQDDRQPFKSPQSI